MTKTIAINVPAITRVEGEGALSLNIKQGKIENLQLKIYEPPRYFEKFLQGRHYNEVIDIVARICGICPVAYQMSAATAIEDCFNIQVSDWVSQMRQVLYCGEWVESHSLHIHLLALPDYYGYGSAIEMAKDYPQEVTRGMRIQGIGNRLISIFGKRSVHPVGACVGGFYSSPQVEEIKTLLDDLSEGIELANELCDFLLSIDLPKPKQNLFTVGLTDNKSYPILAGLIGSNTGFSCTAQEFEQYFQEFQVPYSTAKQCLFEDKAYLVGPLARLNLNYDFLPDNLKQKIANKMNIPSDNMFESIIARAIEISFAFQHAHQILSEYEETSFPNIEVKPRAGIGYGATEAPRGLLWHRYEIDDDGKIIDCDIIPPTSQNQAHIEQDLRYSLEHFGLDKPQEELRLHAEMVIRNYDPCISCSTHFLNLSINED
jgi:sulfhydrogenase subunit alpha